jgi:hypothetical protein
LGLAPRFWVPVTLALASLTLAAGTLDGSSYWLNYDTATQPVEALELVTGCWNYASGKPGVILALAAAYLVAGPSPWIETVMLAGWAAAAVVGVYGLARHISGSTALGALAGLAWLALPAQMVYSRTHLGYPLAWFTLGVWAYTAGRWRWAGLALMAALMGHGTFAALVGVFLLASIAAGRRPQGWQAWAELAAFMLLPWLAFEALSYAFTGVPFEWTRGTIEWYFFYQNSPQATNWWHVWESVELANGTLLALLLAASALYPLARTRRAGAAWPIYITAWAVLAVYTARAGLTQARFIPRAIAGVYPLLAVLSVITLACLARRLGQRGAGPGGRGLAGGAVAGALALALYAGFASNLLAAREFSRTGYPAIEAAFQEASRAGQPVRYWGNQWAGLYFAKLYGVEAAIDDPDAPTASGDTQAMLIFEDNSQDMREQMAGRRGLYAVTAAAHLRANLWPAGVESEVPTPEMDAVRAGYALGPQAGRIEIWRPLAPQGQFTARDDVLTHTWHYTGAGCIVPPRYGFGTQHWYQLVFQRLGERIRNP